MTEYVLPEGWSIFEFDTNVIYYNMKTDVITKSPPFQLKDIDLFFKFYSKRKPKTASLSTLTDFIKASKTQMETVFKIRNENEQFDSKRKDRPTLPTALSGQINTDPIIQAEVIEEIYQKIKTSPIPSNIIQQIFNRKYQSNPNYKYDVEKLTETSSIHVCTIMARNIVLCVAKNESKPAARELVMRQAIKLLCPKLYEMFFDNDKENKKLEEDAKVIEKPVEANQTKKEQFDKANNDFDAACEIKVTKSNLEKLKKAINDKKHLTNSLTIVQPNSDGLSLRLRGIITKDGGDSKKTIKDVEEVIEASYGNDTYELLGIDHPLVVKKYLDNVHTPYKIFQTIQKNNPEMGIEERFFIKNYLQDTNGTKDSYNLIEIESYNPSIKVQANDKEKKLAREYAAQKFLAKLFPDVKHWSTLVNMAEHHRRTKRNFKLSLIHSDENLASNEIKEI